MKLDLLYFAWVRERIGLDGETRDLAAHTVGEALTALSALGDGYASAFAEPHRLKWHDTAKAAATETSPISPQR